MIPPCDRGRGLLGLATIQQALDDLMHSHDRMTTLRAAAWLHRTSTAPLSFRWWWDHLTGMGYDLPHPDRVRRMIRDILHDRQDGATSQEAARLFLRRRAA